MEMVPELKAGKIIVNKLYNASYLFDFCLTYTQDEELAKKCDEMKKELEEKNEKLEDEPELINTDSYGDGWIIKISIADVSELDELLDAAAYQELVG